jgi:hypothetical protein
MITESAQPEVLNGGPFLAHVEDDQSAQTHEPTTMRCTVTSRGNSGASFVFSGDEQKLAAKLVNGHRAILALEIRVGSSPETSVVSRCDGSALPPTWRSTLGDCPNGSAEGNRPGGVAQLSGSGTPTWRMVAEQGEDVRVGVPGRVGRAAARKNGGGRGPGGFAPPPPRDPQCHRQTGDALPCRRVRVAGARIKPISSRRTQANPEALAAMSKPFGLDPKPIRVKSKGQTGRR